jgi:chromosome segregation ATPase
MKTKSKFKRDITDVKGNKTTNKTENETNSLQKEVEQTVGEVRTFNKEFDDRKKLTEKTVKLLNFQSNVIDDLRKKIRDLKAGIKTLENREQELKEQLIMTTKAGKTGSEYNQTERGKLKEQIDELKNTIAEKEKELKKAEETKLNLSVEFKKLTEDMTTMKNDITKKHEEDMAAMKTELMKQNEEVLEQGKRIQSMLSGMLQQKDQDQMQGKRKQNKPKAKPSVESRPPKIPPWKIFSKKGN